MLNCCSLNQAEYSVQNFAKNRNIQNNENIIETESSIFQETENNNEQKNTENSEIEDIEILNISSIDELREEFEAYKEEQGIFGKAIDGIANTFPFLSNIGVSGSNEIDEVIKKAENGEITLEEAKQKLAEYQKKNDRTKEIVLDSATALIVAGVCLLAGPLGWGVGATLLAGVLTGAVTRLGLGATEAATNNVENDYSLEDAQEDITKGGIIGFFTAGARLLGIKLPGHTRNKMVEDNVIQPFIVPKLINGITK